jgi:hypothetical protein
MADVDSAVPADVLKGSCLCGGVRYEISGRIEPIVFCHCTMCRKAQGGAFATNAPVRRDYFRLVAGAELITSYESSPQKWRCFCRVCGSPIYSHRASVADVVRIRLGLLEGDPGRRPAGHVRVEHKALWYQIEDSLPFLDADGRPIADDERKRLSEGG